MSMLAFQQRMNESRKRFVSRKFEGMFGGAAVVFNGAKAPIAVALDMSRYDVKDVELFAALERDVLQAIQAAMHEIELAGEEELQRLGLRM